MQDIQVWLTKLLTLEFWQQLLSGWLSGKAADIAGAALGTILLGLLAWLGIKALFVAWAHRFWRARQVKPLPHDTVNIVIADLLRDDDGSQSEHIRQSLEVQFKAAEKNAPVRVARCHETFDPKDVEAAKARGRAVLKRLNGAVLVWGEVGARDQVLRLRFLSGSEDGAAAAKGYALDTVKELPTDFAADLGAVLMGEAATATAGAYETGRYVVDVLKPAIRRLEALTANMPASFTQDQRGRVHASYAVALAASGTQAGEATMLTKAVAAYRVALQEWTRERVPLQWAMTQNNLGNALRVMGERGDDQALKGAVAAYREALKELNRERVLLDWAKTQNNLGNALSVLGGRGDDQALNESVAAYREALKELPRERVPLDWAMTQNNLGSALRVMGERGDDQALNESVAAFHGALLEWTRERAPLNWAMTQNNRGIALKVLGERGDDQALREAVAAFREALKELTRERVPLDWAKTQNNLGNGLRVMGERGDDQALRDAVAAIREALKEFTRERAPLQWAMTQNNLGSALRVMGERGDDQALNESVAAYREALKEQTRERVPLDWAMTQHNLGAALRVMGERNNDCSILGEARQAALGALEVFNSIAAEHYQHVAQQNLEKIEAVMKKLGCS